MSTPAASPVPSYEYGGASVSFDHITMNQVVQSWMILKLQSPGNSCAIKVVLVIALTSSEFLNLISASRVLLT